MFVGRQEQLKRLDGMLQRVRAEKDTKPCKALLIRGRRRVGKSRLVEEFLDRIDVPHLFFAATGRPVRDELRLFAEEVAASDLPGAELFVDVELASWDAAFRLLAKGRFGNAVLQRWLRMSDPSKITDHRPRHSEVCTTGEDATADWSFGHTASSHRSQAFRHWQGVLGNSLPRKMRIA